MAKVFFFYNFLSGKMLLFANKENINQPVKGSLKICDF